MVDPVALTGPVCRDPDDDVVLATAVAAQASFIVSLIGWTLIPAIPLASFVSERSGRPRLIMLAAFIVMTVAMIVLNKVMHT